MGPRAPHRRARPASERNAQRTHIGSPITSSNENRSDDQSNDGELGVPAAVLAQTLTGAVVLEAVGLDREPKRLAAQVHDREQAGFGDLQLRSELEALLEAQRPQHRLERVGRPTVGEGRDPARLA